MSVHPSHTPRARRVRQTRRSGEVTRSAPRTATSTVRALLALVSRPITVADLCEVLGVHWRTGYRTIRDVGEVVRVRREPGGPSQPGRYWIARADLDRAIRRIQRGEP